jgi:very-short-patch-repair endonuclease
VYAVGHARLTVRGRWMAAVLACGDDALLSHRSAAALWGMAQAHARQIDVTSVGRSRAGPRGITLHRSRSVHDDDRTVSEGIRVTSIARTLLDLAEVVSPRKLERAIEEGERLRLLDLRALTRLCARSRGRHGVAPLRALLEKLEPPPETRSELERLFIQLCRDSGLPRPAVNVSLAGYEVDAHWPGSRLVVELDGYAFHRTRAAFERDRARDARLQLAGYQVLRVTSRRLLGEPRELAAAIRSMLARAL